MFFGTRRFYYGIKSYGNDIRHSRNRFRVHWLCDLAFGNRLPMSILGLVLSIVGNKKQKNGLGTAAFVLSLLAVIFTAITFFTCGLCVICAAGALGSAGGLGAF